MTLVCSGSLASVHCNKQASPSRVSASCSTALHVFFFLLKLMQAPSYKRCYTDSCVVVCIEIAAGIEGQPEVITNAPSGATWFAPDGRLPHIPSLVGLLQGTTDVLGPFLVPRQARQSFADANNRSTKKTAKRSATRGVAAPSPNRQCSHTWKDLVAGWRSSKSVLLRPLQRRGIRVLLWRECPLLRECRRVLRCTKPAFCLELVLALVAVPSKSDAPSSSHSLGL